MLHNNAIYKLLVIYAFQSKQFIVHGESLGLSTTGHIVSEFHFKNKIFISN